MIIMLDEEFDKIEPENEEKTFIEQMSEIFDSKNSEHHKELTDSESYSEENKNRSENAEFRSEKVMPESFFSAVDNDRIQKNPYKSIIFSSRFYNK